MTDYIKNAIGKRISESRLKSLQKKLRDKSLTEEQRRFINNQINKISGKRHSMLTEARGKYMKEDEYKLRRENILSKRK